MAGKENVIMSSVGNSGSVCIQLHPLVVMNISDQYTRIRAQANGGNPQIFGALLGTQEGRNMEILNSFELQFDVIDNDVIINTEYYHTKAEQFSQVFKDLDFLGWYTTGNIANETDLKVHQQMCQINESPVLLKLNPVAARTNELPINMYESVIDVEDGKTRMLFIELPFTLATEEAERIGVDHVAKISSSGVVEGSASEHLLSIYNSIKMLYSRIKIIVDYTKAVQEGELEANHEVMRDILSLTQRLPVMTNDLFKEDFFNQCNDVVLMSYLATITKGCNTMNELIMKFNVVYDRHGVGRRIRGLFF
ncbi:COP9 signalosome complex subunit 6-like [Xenia sp. Carnegie-2017]|uniref:COP9 signalosome complex subunit 6-like n=1 Tax=Xenia sp. Carnegie-2017 TaxID=2897299 RepID=UPI001F044AFD|nr:COP9 signalosome complex subunit 6-like [Xenia sp. Carnegie-2017]